MLLYQAIYFRGVLRIGWLYLIQVSCFSHLIIGVYIYELLTPSNIKKSSFFLHSDSPLVIHFNNNYVYIYTRIATKNHNYLIIKFLYCSFIFFMQCLIHYKSYTLKFKQNLYYSFKFILKSFCALILLLLFVLFIARFGPFFRSMQATAYLYRKNPHKGEKPKCFLSASLTRSAFAQLVYLCVFCLPYVPCFLGMSEDLGGREVVGESGGSPVYRLQLGGG